MGWCWWQLCSSSSWMVRYSVMSGWSYPKMRHVTVVSDLLIRDWLRCVMERSNRGERAGNKAPMLWLPNLYSTESCSALQRWMCYYSKMRQLNNDSQAKYPLVTVDNRRVPSQSEAAHIRVVYRLWIKVVTVTVTVISLKARLRVVEVGNGCYNGNISVKNRQWFSFKVCWQEWPA